MSEELQYSVDGLVGASALYKESADAIFYCEDAGYEEVYRRLLRRVAPRLKRFVVVCTGGKTKTDKLAAKGGRIALPHVMLVDKDFDDLIGEYERRAALGIVYLRRHSLENYLAQIDALREIALEQLSGTKGNFDRERFDASTSNRHQYLQCLQKMLIDAARRFVMARKNRIDIATSGVSARMIFEEVDEQFPLPSEWLEKYDNELLSQAETNAPWLLQDNALTDCLDSAFKTDCKPWGDLDESSHIVGKHLLFGLLSYLDAALATSLGKLEQRELYLRIISHLDVQPLDFLGHEIYNRLAGSQALV